MSLERLFNFCRAISYGFKVALAFIIVAILTLDPEVSVQEYVPSAYCILLIALVITGIITYLLHDITRLTRWVEPIQVCICAVVAELYGLIFKKVPQSNTLQGAYSIYAKCSRSLVATFLTCRNVYDDYADRKLYKARRKWQDEV